MKTIVITGTSRGLGRALAEYYLAQGDFVCGCSRKESDIQSDRYRHACLDVSDEKAVVSYIRAIVREREQIDALINNAGIASMNHSLLSSVEGARRIMDTNFIGSFLFCREVGKVMIRQKGGRIVNFSTVAKPLCLEGEMLYASSKAAVETMTKVMAKEFGASGITVNAVGPTPIPSDLINNVPEDKIQRLLQSQAIQRLGKIEDLINVIEFFISPKSEFITGQVIYLGGI